MYVFVIGISYWYDTTNEYKGIPQNDIIIEKNILIFSFILENLIFYWDCVVRIPPSNI